MAVTTDITIVGAGPFGLSIAAYLREYGLDFRIVGSPMQSWLTKMPKGMLLKSPGFASNLYDPGRIFTLRQFCRDQNIPYQDLDFPISLETFCAYGIAFQKRFAPDLEDDNLALLTQCPEGFELRLASGKIFKTRKVILAVGLDYFRYIPKPLTRLPKELFSHSAEHHEPDGFQRFQGKDVAVLGSGASAIDIAVLLHEAQAKVQQIVRRTEIDFGTPWGGRSRPLWRRIREPISPIGPGWRSKLYVDFPWLYRYLPDAFRLQIVKNHLGPAGGWFMRDRAAPITLLLGYQLQEAKAANGRVQLHVATADGTRQQVSVDHVIAATGFKADVRRLPFLSQDILEKLRHIGNPSRLSAYFESSVPGLYFVGPIAATSFGPVMRFAAGADFTSRRISKHLVSAFRPRSSFINEGSRISKLPKAD